MQLTIDEAYLPVKLTAPAMSDEEFAEFCTLYPDHFIEMTAEGEIVIMPPNYSFTGAQSGEIFGQLRDWASGTRRGIATDSSGGFRLPNGARFAPDAAWTLKSRIQGSSEERRAGTGNSPPTLWWNSDRRPTACRSFAPRCRNGSITALDWLG